MDFGFGEDQELLRTTTRRFLTEHQSLAEVRRSLEEPELFDAAIWRQGADLGWTAMLVPASTRAAASPISRWSTSSCWPRSSDAS